MNNWNSILERIKELILENERLRNKINSLEIENDCLKDDIENLKYELSLKVRGEDDLK